MRIWSSITFSTKCTKGDLRWPTLDYFLEHIIFLNLYERKRNVSREASAVINIYRKQALGDIEL